MPLRVLSCCQPESGARDAVVKYRTLCDPLAGDSLPAVDGKRLGAWVRVAGSTWRRSPRVWAVNPGQSSATLIASISPPPDTIEVLDVSPDGSHALIKLGSLGGSDSTCSGLYLVRVDGSGATRLTTSGRSPTGAFSPDGRRIAYSLSADPGTITTLDLETGATVNQLCGSGYSSFQWTGRRPATGLRSVATSASRSSMPRRDCPGQVHDTRRSSGVQVDR